MLQRKFFFISRARFIFFFVRSSAVNKKEHKNYKIKLFLLFFCLLFIARILQSTFLYSEKERAREGTKNPHKSSCDLLGKIKILWKNVTQNRDRNEIFFRFAFLNFNFFSFALLERSCRLEYDYAHNWHLSPLQNVVFCCAFN